MNKVSRLMLIGLLAMAVGCGSSSSDSSGGTTSSGGEAVSGAVGGTASGATDSASNSAAGQDVWGAARGHVRKGIVSYVTDRIVNQTFQNYPQGGKTVTISDDGTTVAFTDEVITGDTGGTVTMNGLLTLTLTQGNNQITETIDGDLTSVLDDWATSVLVDGTTYNEVVDGTIALAFSGTLVVVLAGDNITSATLDFAVAVTGEDIVITGDAAGTADVDISVAVTGDVLTDAGISLTCSGTVSATTSTGLETCTMGSDCVSCS